MCNLIQAKLFWLLGAPIAANETNFHLPFVIVTHKPIYKEFLGLYLVLPSAS